MVTPPNGAPGFADAFANLAQPRAPAAPCSLQGEARVTYAHEVLDHVTDPEIPVINLRDLGVLRQVALEGDTLLVTITPTYSGCPAMEQMQTDIEAALQAAGLQPFRVQTTLSPAWTTDWISASGRAKLRAYGIAPPAASAPDGHTSVVHFQRADGHPSCPRCASPRTEIIAAHGSTACKALYRCLSCREPFDYFKAH